MASSKDNQAHQRSWKDLPQGGKRKVSTDASRRRRLLLGAKLAGLAAAICALVGGLGWLIYQVQKEESPLALSGPRAPVRQIVFQSDGVLNRDWFLTRFDGVVGRPILDLDLSVLQRLLEATGQIREVTLAVNLPDQLVITVKERQPVLRARVGSDGRVKDLLVAEDGTVFEGSLYPAATVGRLPWMAGVRLQRAESGGYSPVAGMAPVAELLRAARRLVPALCPTLQVVDLGSYYGDPAHPASAIKVRGSLVAEIIFRPRDYEGQLERLAEVLEYAERQKSKPLQRIDLSFDARAVVQYAAATPAARPPTRR